MMRPFAELDLCPCLISPLLLASDRPLFSAYSPWAFSRAIRCAYYLVNLFADKFKNNSFIFIFFYFPLHIKDLLLLTVHG